MELQSKAYLCQIEDFGEGQIFHGSTSSKAKSKALQEWSECQPVNYLDIRAKRDKSFDLIKLPDSPLLKNLSDSQIKKMLHMTGLSVGRNQYRNYYTSFNPVPDLENLIELGLATKFKRFEDIVYSLNEKGLEAIKSKIPVIRQLLTR